MTIKQGFEPFSQGSKNKSPKRGKTPAELRIPRMEKTHKRAHKQWPMVVAEKQ
jgi:hypothetical protein